MEEIIFRNYRKQYIGLIDELARRAGWENDSKKSVKED